MRITFERDGGFAALPGLTRPVMIDTAQLAPEEAERWQRLVAEAAPWDLTSPAPPRRGADQRRYLLEVDDGERRVALTLFDPLPGALRALVRALEDAQRATR